MSMLTLYMFFLCLLYFDLIVQMTYDIICFILASAGLKSGVDYVPITEESSFTFKIFS
jgi:hypothetical protein